MRTSHSSPSISLTNTQTQRTKCCPGRTFPTALHVGSQRRQGIPDVQIQAAAHLIGAAQYSVHVCFRILLFFLHLFRAPETYDIIWIFMARCVKAEAVHLITGVHPCAGVTWIPYFCSAAGPDRAVVLIAERCKSSSSPFKARAHVTEFS